VYVTYVLNELAGNTAIVFVSTCANAQRLALTLRALGFGAVPLVRSLSRRRIPSLHSQHIKASLSRPLTQPSSSSQRANAKRLALTLGALGFGAVPLVRTRMNASL
jgi:hypothetical protein